MRTLNPGNSLNQYADDSYLVVPSKNSSLIPSELDHITEWADLNNLKLNVTKTKELIVHRPRTKLSDIPPASPGLTRVQSINILGVTFQGDLSFKLQAKKLVAQCAQSLYALRTLKAHGLKGSKLWEVTNSTLVARMVYASPVWWGLLDAGCKQQLQAALRKVVKQGFLKPDFKTIDVICDDVDDRLFSNILRNKAHVLHRLLPPTKTHKHDLRPRPHNLAVPIIKDTLFKKTYINQMLNKNSY